MLKRSGGFCTTLPAASRGQGFLATGGIGTRRNNGRTTRGTAITRRQRSSHCAQDDSQEEAIGVAACLVHFWSLAALADHQALGALPSLWRLRLRVPYPRGSTIIMSRTAAVAALRFLGRLSHVRPANLLIFIVFTVGVLAIFQFFIQPKVRQDAESGETGAAPDTDDSGTDHDRPQSPRPRRSSARAMTGF